ncbi:unnamed protein product, partial [Meganyctiphanes norvegica]
SVSSGESQLDESPSLRDTPRSSFDFQRTASISDTSSMKELPPPFLDNDDPEELIKQLRLLGNLVPDPGRNMLGDARSYPFFCSECGCEAESKVQNWPKPIAWIISSIFVLSGCICGCCLLPFMFDPCLYNIHTCRDCGTLAHPPPRNFKGNDSRWHSWRHM